MVNGRILEDELNRIDDFFAALSMEEFEKMALDCGAGVIAASEESIYVKAIPKRYANLEGKRKSYKEAVFVATIRETEAA